jgi:hypothetical protein
VDAERWGKKGMIGIELLIWDEWVVGMGRKMG